MQSALTISASLPPATPEYIESLNQLEAQILTQEQQVLDVWHQIHGGIYSRTVVMPAGSVVMGALIKVPTTLIICGDASVGIGDMAFTRYQGFHVLAGSSGRKQVFVVHEDTVLTMQFRTDATTVDEAEREFTDDFDRLQSRVSEAINHINITGE